ncbi:hypothetical protein PMSD_21190 [Paenibacillus macquariensis subsp. defensor]|nr:hypothetical protein PMSD_21190 [Paenibacillus macquariensis subsp. defensor]
MKFHINRDATEIESAIVVIEEILEKHVEVNFSGTIAYSTSRGYKTDWSDFINWCSTYGYDSLPVDDEAYALYIAGLALNGYKTSTIKRRMSAISKAHIMAGYRNPKTEKVRKVIASVRRAYGTEEIGKEAILIDMLKEMLEYLPDNLKGTRDRAILLIGFAGAFRRSELVSIDIDHLQVKQQGLEILIAQTDQEIDGKPVIIPYGQGSSTCPIKAVQDWIQEAGINKGPLFRPINRHGQLGEKRLSGDAVSLIVKEYVIAAGFNKEQYSSDSLRAGLATSADIAGKREQSIMTQTRHKSDKMIRRYRQMENTIEVNAASDIGL